MVNNRVRTIVYQMKDGTTEQFPLYTVEDEQHERTHAEREIHSRHTRVRSYHIISVGSLLNARKEKDSK